MLILWRTLLSAALWLAFESLISWAAFCHQPEKYDASYQSPEKYECIFRGPVMLILRSFIGWWNHIFDKPDAWVALFTGLLFVSTAALWWSTRKLWKVATENERPWVGTVTVSPDKERNPFGAEIVIRNTGRSPALQMRVAHSGVLLERGAVPAIPDPRNEISKALFPHANDYYYP
jgi:hypothetical protein